MAATVLILRATGDGYQLLELDPEAQRFVAVWPEHDHNPPETPRTAGRERLRPGALKGELRRAYRAAFAAWDGRVFNCDTAVEPPGLPVTLRQASRVGGYRKPWIARITGAHPEHRFAREFCTPARTEQGGEWTFYLTEDSIYEICNRNSRGDEQRQFCRLVGGEFLAIVESAVETRFPPVPRPAAAPAGSPGAASPMEAGGPALSEARRVALALAERVPAGTRKEDWLPFVTAALQHFAEIQALALERDDTAASFRIAEQQFQYLADFRRLAGRDFDPEADRVTWAEVEALPVTPPAPPQPIEWECLECGAVYTDRSAIEPGGMGCRRCNH